MHLYINVKSICSYNLSKKNNMPMHIRSNNINHFPIKKVFYLNIFYFVYYRIALSVVYNNQSFSQDTIHGQCI